MEKTQTLLAIGLNEKDISNLTKNEILATKFIKIVDEIKKSCEPSHPYGPLLLKLVNFIPDNLAVNRLIVAKYIANGKLKNGVQVEEAIKFIKKIGDTPLPIAEFETECGIDINVDEELVNSLVKEKIFNNRAALFESGKSNIGKLVGILRNDVKLLKFVDGNIVKQAVDKVIKVLAEESKDILIKIEEEPKNIEDIVCCPIKKIYNFDARFLETAVNSKELLEQHKERTGGKIMTRFPPEPNGFLHIGHAKAMNLSFGYAMSENGYTYLRYDDTNPEKEDKIYYDSIK